MSAPNDAGVTLTGAPYRHRCRAVHGDASVVASRPHASCVHHRRPRCRRAAARRARGSEPRRSTNDHALRPRPPAPGPACHLHRGHFHRRCLTLTQLPRRTRTAVMPNHNPTPNHQRCPFGASGLSRCRRSSTGNRSRQAAPGRSAPQRARSVDRLCAARRCCSTARFAIALL